MTTRILTGITTTGTPHLGNYAGAIRPAIVASRQSDFDSFYFLADYHALIKCDDPLRIQRSRLEIAATWLAAGLDVDRVTFYRQSDIPEIPELTWLLTCVAAKGLLNRAHAYKASVDKNVEGGEDPDAGITMGLYSYPVLMAADILMFNAHQVPVGRDQIQHVEMARDIGQRFNHLFGNGKEFFVMPEALIEESVATLPGLDGRKMSKSYDNTIPLFSGAKDMKSAISRIVTDSRAPGEAKDPDTSHLFTLYQAFSTAEQCAEFRSDLLQGLGWGEAKNRLFTLLDAQLSEPREKYLGLISVLPISKTSCSLAHRKPDVLPPLSSKSCARRWACGRSVPWCRTPTPARRRPARALVSSASVKTTAASVSVCWQPMASSCCCRATLPMARLQAWSASSCSRAANWTCAAKTIASRCGWTAPVWRTARYSPTLPRATVPSKHSSWRSLLNRTDCQSPGSSLQ